MTKDQVAGVQLSAAEEDKKRKKEAEERRKEEEKQRLLAINVENVWKEIEKKKGRERPAAKENQGGWKTVRIFVSSTFKDFHQEREILVKEVFADLRGWCEQRQLHLIDCDLRWGVPKETTNEATVRTCLEEIDRCFEYNGLPFFLNLTCERVGWIPLEEHLSKDLWKSYELVFGLSVTEMEIMYAAYYISNPNALFLLRDESFLADVKDKSMRDRFIDELQPKAKEKLIKLKEKIQSRFSDRVITYNCKYVPGESLYGNYAAKKERNKNTTVEKSQSEDPKNFIPKLEIEQQFKEKVFNFFKERIEQQYPFKEVEVDEFVRAKNHHEDFIKSRCAGSHEGGQEKKQEMIIGREDVLDKIMKYIEEDTPGNPIYPLLITGDAGAGKSSIMAKAAYDALEKLQCKESSDGWKVFSHFVGAVPNSTSLIWILKRLLKELDPDIDFPEKMQDIASLVSNKLETSTTLIVIFIDALNQIDEEKHVEPTFWIPRELSSSVRCVLSLITNSKPHVALLKNRGNIADKKEILEISVPDLNSDQQEKIMGNYLGSFNKKLDAKQVDLIRAKESSKNPLWLRIACEEMRIYGDFRSIENFIERIEDGLPQLLRQVLERFEAETDKLILKATLCLLETSKTGLLETELLELLADKDHLDYSETMIGESPEKTGTTEKLARLPYVEWANVYRNLRIFLRPYGNPNEGRLDFYHRTLSKVVRDMYLDQSVVGKKSELDDMKGLWWHKKLADFYRISGTYDRKVEEYPYHLLILKEHSRNDEERNRYCNWLQEFLVDMRAFERLYDNEFSADLLFYWRESGDEKFEKMCEKYIELSNQVETSSSDQCIKTEQFSRIMVQAGRYKEALEMAYRCLSELKDNSDKMEKQDYDEKLIHIYSNIGHIKVLTSDDYASAYEEALDYHAKAIEIIKNSEMLDESRYKLYLAQQLNKRAFALGELCRVTCSKDMFPQGLEAVEEAIKLYKEVKDYAHELEAELTKATLHRRDTERQLEIYESTRERCRQIFGEDHNLMCRLCFNTAIVYEEANKLEDAYAFFHRAFELGLKVYGTKHSVTEMYRNVLKEEKFKDIVTNLGHSFD